MKILLSLFSIFVLLTGKVDFVGRSYVVYDNVHQTVLESRNMYYVQSVASISKIMTAIITIENRKLDDKVLIDETIKDAYGSCVYIHTKDRMTIQDLLYGLLLRSGNDCALMLAKVSGKSVKRFVSMMNKKAQEIGMSHSHFSNPSGLDEEDEGNQSCSYDMAILYNYCQANPIFNKIVATKVYKRQDGKGQWHNKNRLLNEYSYCVGGKTGFTKKARRTLVTRAVKDSIDLTIVTIRSSDDFSFHRQKYEEYFKKYKHYPIFNKGLIEINKKNYFLNKDLFLDCFLNDKVNCIVKNQSLYLYVNDHLTLCKKVKTYSFAGGIKKVLVDLIYE